MYDTATSFSMRAHPLKREFGLKMFSRFSGDKLLSQPFMFPIPIFDSHAITIFCKLSLFPQSTQAFRINRFHNSQLAAWCRRLTFEMCEGGGRQLIRTSDDDMIEPTTSDASYSLSLDGCRLPLAKAFNSPWFAFAVLVVTARPGVVKRGPADSHGLLRQWGPHSQAQRGQEFTHEILT